MSGSGARESRQEQKNARRRWRLNSSSDGERQPARRRRRTREKTGQKQGRAMATAAEVKPASGGAEVKGRKRLDGEVAAETSSVSGGDKQRRAAGDGGGAVRTEAKAAGDAGDSPQRRGEAKQAGTRRRCSSVDANRARPRGGMALDKVAAAAEPRSGGGERALKPAK